MATGRRLVAQAVVVQRVVQRRGVLLVAREVRRVRHRAGRVLERRLVLVGRPVRRLQVTEEPRRAGSARLAPAPRRLGRRARLGRRRGQGRRRGRRRLRGRRGEPGRARRARPRHARRHLQVAALDVAADFDIVGLANRALPYGTSQPRWTPFKTSTLHFEKIQTSETIQNMVSVWSLKMNGRDVRPDRTAAGTIR